MLDKEEEEEVINYRQMVEKNEEELIILHFGARDNDGVPELILCVKAGTDIEKVKKVVKKNYGLEISAPLPQEKSQAS